MNKIILNKKKIEAIFSKSEIEKSHQDFINNRSAIDLTDPRTFIVYKIKANLLYDISKNPNKTNKQEVRYVIQICDVKGNPVLVQTYSKKANLNDARLLIKESHGNNLVETEVSKSGFDKDRYGNNIDYKQLTVDENRTVEPMEYPYLYKSLNNHYNKKLVNKKKES